MDVLAVAEAAQAGAAKVRQGSGPVLIEAVTYRFKGHYGGDPDHNYRTRDEIEFWRGKDPLKRLSSQLVGAGVPEAELAELDRQVVQKLNEDLEWALAQPFLSVEAATDHVWIPFENQSVQGGAR